MRLASSGEDSERAENFGNEVDQVLNLYRDHGSVFRGLRTYFRMTAEIGGGDASLPHNSSGLPPSTMRPVSST